MENLVEVKFKYVPFNCKFIFEGKEYKKTSHNRGFYNDGSKVIFRVFKKSKLVKTSNEYFDVIPLIK